VVYGVVAIYDMMCRQFGRRKHSTMHILLCALIRLSQCMCTYDLSVFKSPFEKQHGDRRVVWVQDTDGEERNGSMFVES